MKIHEYQAKAILKKYGVSVPRGSMATSREEAETIAKELLDSGSSGVVVKAQIHAGGRGKGGGVKIAKSVDEAADLAGKMLGMKLITHQTGPEGRIVRRLLIEETLPIARELYLGIVLDRTNGRLVFMASVTELTATLILVPTGVQTLATEFWAYTTNISYSAAAPYAGVMIALAVIPAMLVGRWFSRNRSSSETLVG